MRDPIRCSTVVLLILFFMCTGCSLNYKEGEESTQLSESVPDIVFVNFVHTAVNGDKLVFQLEAERAELFNQKKMTKLSNVRFIEYDAGGGVSVEGRAGGAVYHDDNGNADLLDGVTGYSSVDKVSFSAQSLMWRKDERLLKSRGDEIVRIEKDDGSYIEGRYFSIDVARKSLTFNAAVHGRYIYEKDKNDRE